MTWKNVADIVLKHRFPVLALTVLASLFMGYQAAKVKVTFNGGKVLPVTDSAYIRYNQFKKIFGQDAGTMVIGFRSDRIFDPAVFNDWHKLADTIQHIKGIKTVLSIANLFNLTKDTTLHKFTILPLFTFSGREISSDSVKRRVDGLPFYKGLALSNDGQATLMAITFEGSILNTPKRVPILNRILKSGKAFENKEHIALHYSGLPLIRTVTGDLIQNEFSLFLGLSLLITSVLLLLIFRSAYAVIFPVIVVMLGVIWSLGMLVLMNYEITILTGIIPPLVVIIGIPNSVFILNKYYFEYGLSLNKMEALHKVIEKVGITTFIANVTTAIGFAVLCFTKSELLVQFGLVASLSIMVTFVLSIILVPVIFSYLPEPKQRQTVIQNRRLMQALLLKLNMLVHQKRTLIYTVTILLVLICGFGITKNQCKQLCS